MREDENRLSLAEKEHLHRLAKKSIYEGLDHQQPASPTSSDLKGKLGEPGASFVTLTKSGQLRGCIGSLQAHRPLAEDVLENAFSSAFRDYRFSPVTASEAEQLKIKLSVLTPESPLEFYSEEELISKIRPGIDGLVLYAGANRGTFLPSVWEQLPEPEQFLRHLKLKAGLPENYWSDKIRVTYYTTDEF